MDKLLNFQDDLSKRITKAQSNFRKSPKERITKEYVAGRLEILDQLWFEFLNGHKELMRNFNGSDLALTDYMKKEIYDSTEECYLTYKCELKTTQNKWSNSVAQSGSSSSNSDSKLNVIKLPKINIPYFSGKYAEWPTFRDLFRSMIHGNTNLDSVQKLHYLKGYLSGEAEQLVRHIPIVESNYERCWDLLAQRYNNKKYICHNILKRLLGQKTIFNESANALKDMIDTTNDCLASLENIGVNVKSWDILIVHILTLKLDSESRRQWEFSVAGNGTSDELPTYKQFVEFLTGRYRAIEFLDTKSNLSFRNQAQSYNNGQSNNSTSMNKFKTFHTAEVQCPYCSEAHKIYSCKSFSKVDVESRRIYAQDNNLCFNCLGSNHSAKSCQSQIRCRVCRKKHHSLLHPRGDATEGQENVGSNDNKQAHGGDIATSSHVTAENEDSVELVSCFTKDKVCNQVLLATALVKARSINGEFYSVRALIDQGSQSSFVTESTVQYLGLKKKPIRGTITGVGGNSSLISKGMVNIQLSSRLDPTVVLTVEAYVLQCITSTMPSKKVESLEWAELNDIQLADPGYHTPNKIDILLGAEVLGRILLNGVMKNSGVTLIAQSTTFGWILSGSIQSSHVKSLEIQVMHCCVEDNDTLKKFWELESDEVLPRDKILTDEEKYCEEYYDKTTVREPSGRYVVRLPFRSEFPIVQSSKIIAERRLEGLERKVKKDQKLKSNYIEVIKEYLTLEHMKRVPESESREVKETAVYLPHHAVVRENKDTSKTRVVFDASCKGRNNQSLNDFLLVGPSLQSDLRHILIRWRTHAICLVADIVKMYRQIRVNTEDTKYQRILWRENPQQSIGEYELTRVTFGTASAPFLAVKTLQKLAEDEKNTYPNAADIVKKDFYMDDLLTGGDNVEQVSRIFHELNCLLKSGGFELQKWSSNDNEVLKSRDDKVESMHKEQSEELQFKWDQIIKILGLTWNRGDDTFSYSVNLTDLQEPVTKRKIIADISRFYDPLGWVGPCTIVNKIMIQKLWLSGIGWDEKVPTNILTEWTKVREELIRLTEVSLPRWIGTTKFTKLELHGFCDASKHAYAAVVYVCVKNNEGKKRVTLLTSKTKVAPVKQISIPRLELCGAVLLSRLLMEAAQVLKVEINEVHAWTDSTIVLAWINSHPSRWKVFVANRVSEILTNLDSHNWSHVNTKENPADCASRGLYPSELIDNDLWFSGPKFLLDDQINYCKPENYETNLEEIKVSLVCPETEDRIIDRFSSLNKMVRSLSYCRRFIGNTRKTGHNITEKFLRASELKQTLYTIIKQCQRDSFSKDIELIISKHNLPRRSVLKSLNPFLDEDGILRVGGRLENATMDFNKKHPIIIPNDAHLTKLIVENIHQQTLHGGPQAMLRCLQSKYYVIGAQRLVKAVYRKCVTCVKNAAITKSPLMGQLPSVRMTPMRPFKNCGVDYAGPIQIRATKGRGHKSYKGYICLFVCMATRAVHLEAVTDLTSEAFLQAFKRLVARRGYCSELWSDNGTNFVGAEKDLKRLTDTENSTLSMEIVDSLATLGCSWHFIPPHAPNFGGLWEAGIKSVKYHLKRVIGDSTLTYEEMSTTLAQIEACLNSRPICRLSDSEREATVLTPGHFLIGEPLISAPDNNFESAHVGSLRRWQYTQRMLQDFWRQWSHEYLTHFFHRYKWSDLTVQPKLNDIVVVKEDNLPPSKWLYGRVIAIHPGLDQICRVVSIKTKESVIKRPTNKLCILPVAE